MIITINGIIVFHLIERIAIATKSSEEVYDGRKNMLAFSYLAIPTRHEVQLVPAGREDKNKRILINPKQTHKTLKNLLAGESKTNIEIDNS